MAYLIAFLLLLTAAATFLLLVADSLYRHRGQAVDLTERRAADLHLGSRVTLTRTEPVATDSPALPTLVRKRLGIVIAVALVMAFLLLLVA